NKLPHIDIQLFGDEGELVRESDVDIAERVLRQLGHLRSDVISGQKLPVTERSVNLRGAAGCLRSLATYDAVISAQLLHCVTGEDALRAVSEVNHWRVVRVVGAVCREVRAKLEKALRHLGRGLGRGGGLKHDEFVAF